jgi:hypothetical protein
VLKTTWGLVLIQLYLHHVVLAREQLIAQHRIHREDLGDNRNRLSQLSALQTSQFGLRQSDTKEQPIVHQEPTTKSHYEVRQEESQAQHLLQCEWPEKSFSQDVHLDVVLEQELQN